MADTVTFTRLLYVPLIYVLLVEAARAAGQAFAGSLLPRATLYAGAAAGCTLMLSALTRPHAIEVREARPPPTSPPNTVIIFDDLQDMRRYGVILWHIWYVPP